MLSIWTSLKICRLVELSHIPCGRTSFRWKALFSLLRNFELLAKKNIKVPIAANCKGFCLQTTSKSHSYHLKLRRLL